MPDVAEETSDSSSAEHLRTEPAEEFAAGTPPDLGRPQAPLGEARQEQTKRQQWEQNTPPEATASTSLPPTDSFKPSDDRSRNGAVTQSITNNAPQENQTNLQAGQMTFGDVFLGPASEATRQKFEDPTKELPSKITIPEFSLDEYPHLTEALEEHRTIILSSFDRRVSFSAAHALTRHDIYKSYDKRLLVIEKKIEEGRSDLSIDIFSRREYRDKQIILVEIIYTGRFLESLQTESIAAPDQLRKSLADKHIAIVCTTSCELLGVPPDQANSKTFPFYHCDIPYLYHKLTHYYHPRERARAIEKDLLRQREQKLWADFPKIDDFFREIANLLSSPGQLEAEIERRDSIFRERLSVESIEMLKSVRPVDLLADGDLLRATVLYTATYFRDLTPNDFERIICLLLGDATTEVETESQVVNEKGDVQVRRERITRYWIDLWNESPDRVLRECSLEAVSRDDSPQVIDFTKGYLRQDLRAHLESRYSILLARNFKTLQNSGLLFRQDVSEAIVDNLVRLSVERTISDPSYCNRDWLIQLIVMLRIHFETREGQEDPSGDFLALLARLRENEILRRHFYSRLCQLIREMLQHAALRETIQSFLNFLVAHEHGAALDIVLELARRLRFSPEFEAFYWIKRLLDQGRLEIQKRTYQCLFALVNESDGRFYAILEAIRGWLPETTLDVDRYSQSNHYALTFLPDYCFATAQSFPAKHYGGWPCRHTLFAALPSDLSQAREKLDLLAGWFTHPGLKSTVSVEGIDSEDLLARFMADLIELWILILEGVEPRGAHPQAQLLARTLLDAFAARIDRRQQIPLIRRWQWRQQVYYKQVNLLPVHKWEERKALLAKRKKLLEVNQRFVQAGSRHS